MEFLFTQAKGYVWKKNFPRLTAQQIQSDMAWVSYNILFLVVIYMSRFWIFEYNFCNIYLS